MPFMHEDLNKKNNYSQDETDKENNKIENNSVSKVDTISDNQKINLSNKQIRTETVQQKEDKNKTGMNKENIIKEDEEFNQEKIIPSTNGLFSWETNEYIGYQKGFLWYLVVIILTLLLMGGAFYFKQWLLMVLILMFCVVIIQYSKAKPRVRKYKIFDQGIQVDDEIHYFKEFKFFWFNQIENRIILNFQPKKRLSLPITMPLVDKIKIEELRDFLLQNLPEEKLESDFFDRLIHKIKF